MHSPIRVVVAALTLHLLLSGCGGGEKPLPQSFLSLFEKGVAQEKEGKYVAAMGTFEEALKIVPDHPGANYEMAGLYQLTAQNEAAVKHMAVVMEQPGAAENPLYLIRDADVLSAVGRVEEAALQLEKLMEVDPANPDIYTDYCTIKLKTWDLDSVVAVATRALAMDLDPRYPYHAAQLLYTRGVAYERKKELEKAEKDLREAMALCPQFSKVYHALGNMLVRQGRGEEGERLLEAHKRYNAIEERLETIYTAVGQQEENRPQVFRTLIALHSLLGQFRAADKVCDILMEMEGPNPDLLVRKGFIKFSLQEYAVAERSTRAALEVDPYFKTAWDQLALFYATAEDESFRDLEKAHKVMEEARPYGGISQQVLAEVQHAEGKTDLALTTLRRALARGDGDFRQLKTRIEELEEELAGSEETGEKD